MPPLGTGPDQPIVVSHWFAAEGDSIWEGDRLVEVVVGAATVDVPAPRTGRLTETRAREDDAIAPGDVLGWVAVSDDDRIPEEDGLDSRPDGGPASGRARR